MYCILSLSPLTVLSTSFFPACYPFVGALSVSCFVYTCVYSCVPTCTLLYTRVYAEAFITTSFRGSLLLYGWALLGSPEGLVPTRRMDTSQHNEWARANAMDSLFSSLRQAPLVIVMAPPINNVPACEGIGNLRYDLELW